MCHVVDFSPRYIYLSETDLYLRFILFPRLFSLYCTPFINYHSRIKRFPLFNHECTKRAPLPRHPFVLVRILSVMIARYPRRINWSRLALAINLARVERRCPRACVTAWCNVVVGVLVDCRLSSTISAPEVLMRPHIGMTVVDRTGELTVFYILVTNAREFRLGARLDSRRR